MLIYFPAIFLFSTGLSIKTELCTPTAVVFRGTDLIKNARGQIVLISFMPLQCPKCREQLEKLTSIASTFHGLRLAVLAPHWENYAVIGKVQSEFPRLLIDKDVDSTYERLGINEHEIAIFDKCGRLAHVIPSSRSALSQFDDTLDALKVSCSSLSSLSAQSHAVCGWCSYSSSPGSPSRVVEKEVNEAHLFGGGGPVRVARNYGSSILGFEKVDVWLKAQTATDYDRIRKEEERRRSQATHQSISTSYGQHRASPTTSYQFAPRPHQPQQNHQQPQNPHHQSQQIPQNPQNRHPSQSQGHQVTRQPPQTPLNYRGNGYSSQNQPGPGQQRDQSYQVQQLNQQNQLQRENYQGQQPNQPQRQNYESQQQRNPQIQRNEYERARNSEQSRQPFTPQNFQNEDQQNRRSDPRNQLNFANQPTFSPKTTPIVKTTTTQQSKFVEEDYDYYLGSGGSSTTEAPVQTQIPRPSLQPWWSSPPPTIPMQQQISVLGEENIPCTAYTDDVCFHQQEKVGSSHISKCCTKRIYFTDLCVPGKCSNSTIQLCCMQKFLQSRYACCNDESQSDGSTPTDKFSRCCHDIFTVEDDCCPKYAAKTYWESAHELCFPNTKIHLEKIRMEVRFAEGVRVVDLGENRLWDHDCPFGINRQQYAYVPSDFLKT